MQPTQKSSAPAHGPLQTTIIAQMLSIGGEEGAGQLGHKLFGTVLYSTDEGVGHSDSIINTDTSISITRIIIRT